MNCREREILGVSVVVFGGSLLKGLKRLEGLRGVARFRDTGSGDLGFRDVGFSDVGF